MATYFVECVEPGRTTFIAAGDLMEHDARYWRDRYSERHPASTFTVKQQGTSICKHGVPSRGFCQTCDG